jgi:hypothetical protein
VRAILQVVKGTQAKRRFVVAAGQTVTFGRTPAADHQFPDDERMSGQHFSVAVKGLSCVLCDLSSRNGTFVDERRVVEHALAEGNQIRAGETCFTVTLEDLAVAANVPATAQPVHKAQAARPMQTAAEGAPPLSPGAILAASLAQKAGAFSPKSNGSVPTAAPVPAAPSRLSIPEPFKAALADADNIVRRHALLAAAWSGQPWVLDHCRAHAMYAAPADPEIWLLFAILGQPDDLPRILASERYPDLGPARYTILAAFGHPQVMNTVITGIPDSDPEIAAAASAAFAKLTGCEVPTIPETSLRDTKIDDRHTSAAAGSFDSQAATRIWLDLKRKLATSTRWCRGLDLSQKLTPELLARLDLESRWEACLRGRFQRTWKSTPLDQEQLADKLSS